MGSDVWDLVGVTLQQGGENLGADAAKRPVTFLMLAFILFTFLSAAVPSSSSILSSPKEVHLAGLLGHARPPLL